MGLAVPAFVLVCVSLIYLASPAMDGSGDPDFWWHMLYARWMMDNGSIPTKDFISWAFEGQPYLLTQWLGQLLIGMAHYTFGSPGTALLTLACINGVVLISWLSSRDHISNGVVSFAVAGIATTTFWSTYARPQMFSFLCMAVLVLIANRALSRGWTWKPAALSAAIMVLWVNLHGSYVVGLIYLFVLVMAKAVEALFKPGGAKDLMPSIKPWLMVFGLCALGTLLNPHGWQAWMYVVEIAGLQTTTSGVIMEWAPTSFGTGVGSTYILLLLATVLAMALSSKKPTTVELVTLTAMGVFGLLASRQSFYATIVLVPILARAAAGTSLGELASRTAPAKVPHALVLVAFVACGAIGQYANAIREKGLDSWQRRIFPVDAMAFIKKEGIKGRIFNEVTAGGWIAYNSGEKIFIDGRLDLYKDPAFFEWFFTRNGTPGWSERLERMGGEVFILQNQSALTQLLVQGGKHAVVHSDGSYAVLLPKTAAYEKVIERNAAKISEFKIFDSKGNLVASPMGW